MNGCLRVQLRRHVCLLGALVLLASCASPSSLFADDQGDAGEIPPALTEYKGRTIAQTMHYLGADWLTRESRQREEDCESMLEALGIKEGQTICDMGCGNGFYTLKL